MMVATDDLERIGRLIVGIGCIAALIYFLWIELMHPELALSDRAFWVLVAIAASALALKDLQYIKLGGGKDGGGGGD